MKRLGIRLDRVRSLRAAAGNDVRAALLWRGCLPRGGTLELPIRIEEEVLSDLRARIRNTRWPHPAPGIPWEQGTDLDYLRQVRANDRHPPEQPGALALDGPTPAATSTGVFRMTSC